MIQYTLIDGRKVESADEMLDALALIRIANQHAALSAFYGECAESVADVQTEARAAADMQRGYCRV